MVLTVALWALLFGSSFKQHMQTSSDPGIINDDARHQIWPFFPFRDTALFPNDYLRDYVLKVFNPLGYRLTFTLLAPLVDPSVLSKVLPYLLLGATLASVSIASRLLGGLTSFFAAGGLCLSSELFLSRMAGGLPRAFGFPVLALALLALASGRVMLLVTAVLIGVAFYPAAAVAPGLALAFLLLFLPQQDRGSAREWSIRRRVFVLGSVAIISVLLTLPMVLGGRAFGSRIAPSQVREYPEAGPGGRYGLGDRAPFSGFLREAIQLTKESFRGGGEPVLAGILPRALEGRLGLIAVLGLLALMGLGLLLLSFRDAAGRRVAALAVAVVVGHSLARAFAPYLYLPQRHVLYSIPVLALCLVPTSAFVLGGFLGGRMRPIGGPAAVLLVTGFCWASFGAGVGAWTGLMDVRQDKRVHSFLTSLPKNVLVAGFPGGKIEGVPYFSRRRALLTFETHQAFHTGYVEEMRRRMRALIAAYFATEAAPITRLHDDFGATHLIIDKQDFGPQAPDYFEPFESDVRRAHAAGRGKGFAALKLAEDLTVFSERDVFILDLRRLRRTGPDSWALGADRTGRKDPGRPRRPYDPHRDRAGEPAAPRQPGFTERARKGRALAGTLEKGGLPPPQGKCAFSGTLGLLWLKRGDAGEAARWLGRSRGLPLVDSPPSLSYSYAPSKAVGQAFAWPEASGFF